MAKRGNFGQSVTHHLYQTYRRNAARRSLKFDMTLERFEALCSQTCYYCGAMPRRIQVGRCYGFALMNGIDRIDSRRGYDDDNVRTACKDCNIAKHQKSEDEFRSLVHNIYRHWASKEPPLEDDTD